ncbi:SDR family NAD(P)-dependent oxidoreductase [Treponema sp. HNW]|uniref:SDR family NAD(P)-dependent oxidoreductase n=1 Tax=Treponema sp. HNW TaxID=3116654 RepID=UPI003D0C7668
MNNAVFTAPLIRGAAIQKAGKPWTVRFFDKNPAPSQSPVRILIDTDDEKAAAETVHKAFDTVKEGGKNAIPAFIEAVYKGESAFFITAPDMPSLKAAQSGTAASWPIDNTLSAKAGSAVCPSCRADVVKNRVALVTGGAQGFGEEIVRGLINQGAVVCIADLNIEGAEKLASALNTEYGKEVAFAVKVNVADEESVREMVETIALKAGGLDLCVSNAGVLRASSILEQDIASFRFVTDINYTAFAIVSKHCAALMKRQNAACPSWTSDIIQINSKSGLEGSNKNGAYAGGKFGSIGLVESFALELVGYGIKVNAVCPGNFFDGPLWSDPEKGLFVQYLKTGKVPGAKTVQDVKAFYEAKVPMNRGCSGPDVLRAVLYLVEQVYETGQALPVTGGQVMLH